MKYLALIYASEKDAMSKGEAFFNQVEEEYRGYEKWLATEQPGKKLAGEALTPTNTATTLRIRNGKLMTTDGPFAETREQLGGFYLIEASNLDEAIEIAERVPPAKFGTVEIRPVMEIEGLPAM